MPRKTKTQDEFIEEINILGKCEFEVLGNYKNKRTKVKMRHKLCEYEWMCDPSGFLYRGTRCPNCSRLKSMNNLKYYGGRKKLSHDEYLNKLVESQGDNFKLIGKYCGSNIKIETEHKCGHVWFANPHELLKGKGKCPKCIKKNKTHEEFLTEISELVGEEYNVLSKYAGTKNKVKMRHNNCGYTWDVKATAFLHNGTRCPKCNGGIKKIRTHEDFLSEIKNIPYLAEYEIVTKYRNSKEKMSFICKIHGEFSSKPQNFIKHGCGKCCFDNRSKTHDQFERELEKKYNGNIITLDRYKRSNIKMNFKCRCGYEWETVPNHILSGYGCHLCNRTNSLGENIIENILRENNLKFIKEYGNENCKYKNVLRFDYLVEDKVIIEYDGKQHYKPVDFGGKGVEWAEKDFEIRKIQDNIKNEFCINNNILLFRIPYWDIEVTYILEQILSYASLKDISYFDCNIIHRYLVNHPNWKHNKYLDQPLKINNQISLTCT